MQVVEGMEQLLLGAFLAGDELDVVDEQNVRRPVLFAECGHVLAANRLNQVVGEGFRGNVAEVEA